ncbi:MAG: hypothetical protein AB7F79_01345 [Steroidobacteraceae bacterium]
MSVTTDRQAAERQRRIRRNVWWLAALALAFYAGFIFMTVSGARG